MYIEHMLHIYIYMLILVMLSNKIWKGEFGKVMNQILVFNYHVVSAPRILFPSIAFFFHSRYCLFGYNIKKIAPAFLRTVLWMIFLLCCIHCCAGPKNIPPNMATLSKLGKRAAPTPPHYSLLGHYYFRIKTLIEMGATYPPFGPFNFFQAVVVLCRVVKKDLV